MGCDVFANSNEIACKKGGNKVIAEFPDVCLSPPSPPAGPVLIPYPDTSFSKDMMSGSKTVKLKSQELMLKDPGGNELILTGATGTAALGAEGGAPQRNSSPRNVGAPGRNSCVHPEPERLSPLSSTRPRANQEVGRAVRKIYRYRWERNRRGFVGQRDAS